MTENGTKGHECFLLHKGERRITKEKSFFLCISELSLSYLKIRKNKLIGIIKQGKSHFFGT